MIISAASLSLRAAGQGRRGGGSEWQYAASGEKTREQQRSKEGLRSTERSQTERGATEAKTVTWGPVHGAQAAVTGNHSAASRPSFFHPARPNSLVLLRLLLQLRNVDVALGIHTHGHNGHARLQGAAIATA